MAQYTLIQPDAFRVPFLGLASCGIGDGGKMAYNNGTASLLFCRTNQSTIDFGSPWLTGPSSIYYLGKVGLRNAQPAYTLDVFGIGRMNNAFVGGKIGINTKTPTEKVEVKNGQIAINSTGDNKSWRFNYSDTNHGFYLIESGLSRINIYNGGNVSAGSTGNTYKLEVSGTGSYAGNVLVNGQGLLQNTNAAQLKMYMMSVNTPSVIFTINPNSCSTTPFTFPSATFNIPPAVAIGQKISNVGTNDEKLIISVESVTASGGFVKFCNNSVNAVSINNYSYSIYAIGQ